MRAASSFDEGHTAPVVFQLRKNSRANEVADMGEDFGDKGENEEATKTRRKLLAQVACTTEKCEARARRNEAA
jgi:hypothetical protein